MYALEVDLTKKAIYLTRISLQNEKLPTFAIELENYYQNSNLFQSNAIRKVKVQLFSWPIPLVAMFLQFSASNNP